MYCVFCSERHAFYERQLTLDWSRDVCLTNIDGQASILTAMTSHVMSGALILVGRRLQTVRTGHVMSAPLILMGRRL